MPVFTVSYYHDVTNPRFLPGHFVRKVGGRDHGVGKVCGLAWMPDGYWLYTVAMRVENGNGYFARVFPEGALEYTSASTQGETT